MCETESGHVSRQVSTGSDLPIQQDVRYLHVVHVGHLGEELARLLVVDELLEFFLKKMRKGFRVRKARRSIGLFLVTYRR